MINCSPTPYGIVEFYLHVSMRWNNSKCQLVTGRIDIIYIWYIIENKPMIYNRPQKSSILWNIYIIFDNIDIFLTLSILTSLMYSCVVGPNLSLIFVNEHIG